MRYQNSRFLQMHNGVEMNLSMRKKYVDLIESMMEVLLKDADPNTEVLLKPLRTYIKNIEDFTSQRVVEDKFKSFVMARDERLGAHGGGSFHSDQAEIEKSQKAINKILDQVLGLLERGLHSSESVTVDVREIMQKVYEAKTINSVRALSEAVLDLGEMMVSRSLDFQSGMSNLAVELSHCRSQIQDLEDKMGSGSEADYDELTGLRNRKLFERDLNAAVERVRRFRNELCLLIVNIDGFSGINEKWGVEVGNDVLLNFGKLLQRSLREFDLTFRLDGDIFGVVFNGCGIVVASKVADRVRAFISNHVYHTHGVDFSMTISGGLAQLGDDDKDASALYDRVCALLAEAKQNGGNHIQQDGL